MIPILAAVNAIGTIEKIANGVLSAFKGDTSAQATGTAKPSGGSFASLLSGQSVDVPGPARAGAASQGSRTLDATAHRLLNRLA